MGARGWCRRRGPRSRRAGLEEGRRAAGSRAASSVAPARRSGDQAGVRAERDEVLDILERKLAPDVLDHVVDVAEDQLLEMAGRALERREALAQADRTDGIGARMRGLSPMQGREVGAAAAHLGDEAGLGRELGQRLEGLTDCEIGEAVLLGAVDDFHVDAGADPDPIQHGIPIGGLAKGRRGHRAIPDHAEGVHDGAEAFDRLKDGFHGGLADPAAREGVLAEQHAAREVLEDVEAAAVGAQLGHRQLERAGPDVDHGHGRRRRRRARPRRGSGHPGEFYPAGTAWPAVTQKSREGRTMVLAAPSRR